MRYTFELVEDHHGQHVKLYDIPADYPLVYDMLCRADTVGVFQIESWAWPATTSVGSGSSNQNRSSGSSSRARRLASGAVNA